MISYSPRPGQEYSVELGEDGKRTVKWSVGEGQSVRFMEHSFPDALSHPYYLPGPNEDIELYKGLLTYSGHDGVQQLTGRIRLKWSPAPSVYLHGYATGEEHGFGTMFDQPSDQELFVPRATVKLLGSWHPDDLIDEELVKPEDVWLETEDNLAAQDFGDPDELDCIRFLVPNGTHGYAEDQGVCDPGNLVHYWPGRTVSSGGGWTVTLDEVFQNRSREWRDNLRDTNASGITHIGQLARKDGASFSASEAALALKSLNIAFNLSWGRLAETLLPVGYKDHKIVWARWSNPRISPMKSVQSWLDPKYSSNQVSELIDCMLATSEDAYLLDVLHYATSYFLTANSQVAAEIGASNCVSALQMLAYVKLLEQDSRFSEAQFADLGVAKQIRALLSLYLIDIDAPPYFTHLAGLIGSMQWSVGTPDTINAIVKLRNATVHPTKRKPADFPVHAWVEASIIGREYLLLAILAFGNYKGRFISTVARNVDIGSSIQVPWVTDSLTNPAATT